MTNVRTLVFVLVLISVRWGQAEIKYLHERRMEILMESKIDHKVEERIDKKLAEFEKAIISGIETKLESFGNIDQKLEVLKKEIEECRKCSVDAQCLKESSEMVCRCGLGYLGDGKTCFKKESTCSKLKTEADGDSNKRYKQNRESCYLFYPNSGLTWANNGRETARAYCQELNADLVAVETYAENDFIRKIVDVTDTNMPTSSNYWVLGAKRRANSNEYYWVQTGNPITFGDWDSGYPDYRANTYVYMGPRSGRKWGTFKGSENNIICEANISP